VLRLLGKIGDWKHSARWYAFALFYMMATKLIAAGVYRAVLGAWPTFSETPLAMMFAGVLLSTWVQAGEEVGWRGYALPRLTQRIGLGAASVVIGVIWALWHLPLFYLAGSGSDGQSFLLYLIHVTALSVTMGWLYWNTNGSLLPVMVMHAAVNNTAGIVPAALASKVNPMSFEGSTMAWLTLGVAWVIALPLLWQMLTQAAFARRLH
jgi:membrane protease YdiL (CAAX protease family)